MTTRPRAVFLSYASQDAEAAQRICEALRAADIEVWFDKRELRSGDAWDRAIRQQIRECALFIPVISANTEARHEGYFRLEWKLAVDRTHSMSERTPFLVPAVVDGTSDPRADVPDRFRDLQWARLPAGQTPPAFVHRIKSLLSGDLTTTEGHALPASSVRSNPGGPREATYRRRGVLYGVIALVAFPILGYLGYEQLDRIKRNGPGVPGPSSIAVLPLINESGEPSQQYFSDGITEDLIAALGQLQGLKVIGRSSAFQFRDSKEDSRSIGAKLGVAHLLEGSVRKSGDVIRVSAELIDTADGSMQWSEHYDRAYKDLFSVQDEITHAVAQALKTKLLPGEHATEQSERPPSGSLEAYNALIQGRFYAFHNSEADLHKAIDFFNRAVGIDPRYAFALSRLSSAWMTLVTSYGGGAAAQEGYAKAREAADRALTLSPDLAAAHTAMGRVLMEADFDWQKAEAEYRHALVLAPNDAQVKFHLGTLYATLGRLEPAIEVTRQALANEPLRAGFYNTLGSYLLGLNRLDDAAEAMRRAVELQPGGESFYFQIAAIEIQRGNAQAALSAAQQEHSAAWKDVALTLARQIGSDQNAADLALDKLIKNYSDVAPFQIAEIYALRGDAKATFEWLDRAASVRDAGVENLLYDPFILRYKRDPRFAEFCRKLKLPVPGEAPASNSP